MKTTLISVTLIALSTVLGGSAYADCGSAAAPRQALFLPGLPSVGLRTIEARAALPDAGAALDADDVSQASIVGLWDVTFTSGGQLYDEGIDLYTSDGTEIMNDITPPSGGNICLGVWVKTGHRSYKLKHPFWIFDSNGNLIGRGVLQEQFTLDTKHDSYEGTFTFQFRDLGGNTISSMPDVSGTLTAQRITVE
jgi:hypothetical protein